MNTNCYAVEKQTGTKKNNEFIAKIYGLLYRNVVTGPLLVMFMM